MRKILLNIVFFAFIVFNAQEITGKWKTIDDKSGETKSIIEIFEKNGTFFGKVVEIFNKKKRDALCEKCVEPDKNKPVLGMVIIKNMKKNKAVYEDGTITDPENGKMYSCSITPKKNKLEVRGYLGISMFGRSQTWEKVE
jgi:uncharacterized protein (DUF2147 family)